MLTEINDISGTSEGFRRISSKMVFLTRKFETLLISSKTNRMYCTLVGQLCTLNFGTFSSF